MLKIMWHEVCLLFLNKDLKFICIVQDMLKEFLGINKGINEKGFYLLDDLMHWKLRKI